MHQLDRQIVSGVNKLLEDAEIALSDVMEGPEKALAAFEREAVLDAIGDIEDARRALLDAVDELAL